MDKKTFDELVAGVVAHTATMLVQKGDEYAGDADRLMNFKRNAKKKGEHPLETWKQYIGKHLDSLDTYFIRIKEEAVRLAVVDIISNLKMEHGGTFLRDLTVEGLSGRVTIDRIVAMYPQAMKNIEDTLSEPIEGRFLDIINYAYLGLALLAEIREPREK